MAVTKPTDYLAWTDGAASKVTKPPSSQLLSGWTAGEPPPFQYMNWLFYTADQWIQYFDQTGIGGGGGSGGSTNTRLINGGNFSLSGTTLAWSAAFNLSVPSLGDSANQVAAGSVSLPSATSVAYIQANIPINVTGTTQSGNTQISSLSSTQGIVAGQSISGSGIAAGTTVISISGSSLTMSAAATVTATSVPLAFASSATPSVQSADISALTPTSGTVVIARRSGNNVIVGVGAGQMLLRDGESKALLDAGFIGTFSATGGEALTVGQAVYVSPGGSDGRTAGRLYRAEASVGNGLVRSLIIGLATRASSSGASALVVTEGLLTGLSGLVVGAAYYLDPSNPGALTATRPSASGTFAVPVGMALSTSSLWVMPFAGAASQQVSTVYSVNQYGVSNETQLSAALAACVTAGGGVISIQAPFSISSAYTIPSATKLEGGMGGTVITVASGGSLTMASGSTLYNVHLTTANTSGTVVSMANNYAIVRECKITVPPSSTCIGINVTGSSNRIYDCIFAGVQGSVSATGYIFASGTSNRADSPVFI